jgi:hypothetical protein
MTMNEPVAWKQKKMETVTAPKNSATDLAVIETILHNLSVLEGTLNELDIQFGSISENIKDTITDLNEKIAHTTRMAQDHITDVPVVELTEQKRSVEKVSTQSIGKCATAILTALAQRGHPSTKSQIGGLCGYSKNSSGFQNALSKLRVLGFITGRGDGISITKAGENALGRYEPLPMGELLHQFWYGKLGKAEAAILKVLVLNHPAKITKQAISTQTGYSATSSGFQNSLSRLRSLALIEGYDTISASGSLF